MIRPLGPAEVERVLDMWERLLANGQAADPRFRAAAEARTVFRPWVREQWTRSEPFPHCLLTDGGFVAGFPAQYVPVLDQPRTARIGDLWVEPDARGQGVGRALVQRFVENAARAGFPQIEVGTLAADARAVGFWRAMGFADWQVTLRRS